MLLNALEPAQNVRQEDIQELVEEVHRFEQGARSRSSNVVGKTSMPEFSVPSSKKTVQHVQSYILTDSVSISCGSNVHVTQRVQTNLSSIETAGNTNLNVSAILYNIIGRKNLDSHSSAGWGSWAPNIAWSTGEQDEGVAATN